MSEVKPPRTSEETLTPPPLVEGQGVVGPPTTSKAQAEVLAYARPDDGPNGPETVVTVTLPLSILYGLCFGTLALSILGHLVFVFLHVAVCGMMLVLGSLAVWAFRRVMEERASVFSLDGVAGVGLVAVLVVPLTWKGGFSGSELALGLLSAGSFCFAVSAWRYTPRYVEYSCWAHPVDPKLAWSLRRFGFVRTWFEGVWFAVCGLACGNFAFGMEGVLPETLGTILLNLSVIGWMGFLFCWLWMMELHGKLFKARHHLRQEI